VFAESSQGPFLPDPDTCFLCRRLLPGVFLFLAARRWFRRSVLPERSTFSQSFCFFRCAGVGAPPPSQKRRPRVPTLEIRVLFGLVARFFPCANPFALVTFRSFPPLLLSHPFSHGRQSPGGLERSFFAAPHRTRPSLFY